MENVKWTVTVKMYYDDLEFWFDDAQEAVSFADTAARHLVIEEGKEAMVKIEGKKIWKIDLVTEVKNDEA